jgi:hypothetical protein
VRPSATRGHSTCAANLPHAASQPPCCSEQRKPAAEQHGRTNEWRQGNQRARRGSEPRTAVQQNTHQLRMTASWFPPANCVCSHPTAPAAAAAAAAAQMRAADLPNLRRTTAERRSGAATQQTQALPVLLPVRMPSLSLFRALCAVSSFPAPCAAASAKRNGCKTHREREQQQRQGAGAAESEEAKEVGGQRSGASDESLTGIGESEGV